MGQNQKFENLQMQYFPEECPFCGGQDLRRHTYKMREIQDLGSPMICRRIYYERVYFICKRCRKIFNIEHPLIPVGFRYIPGVIYKENPQLRDNKALKVVWESSMRKINKLYQAQYGLRTLENIQMRISNYLKCPIIVAPNALEEF